MSITGRLLAQTLLLASSLWLSACGTMGSSRMPDERKNYNEAMAVSNNQQLLQNIVRIHDGTPPLFLQVTNISTQDAIEANASLGLTHVTGDSASDTASITPGVTLAEKPTVSYVPMQGTTFANQLLNPLSLRDIYLLCRGGWPVDQIFSLVLEDINNLPNIMESSPSSYNSNTIGFDAVLADLRQLQQQNALRFYYSIYKKVPVLVLNVTSAGQHASAWKDLVTRLHLHPKKGQLFLSEYHPGYPTADLYVETRSFMGVLVYLSKAVPDAEGKVDSKYQPIQQWLSLKSSLNLPSNSYLAVQYHQRWYYLDAQDETSKGTMLSLFELFELVTGQGNRDAGPVLTLPLR